MRFAVPLDRRLQRKLRNLRLDVPSAEICRQLGAEAAHLGVTRPSYATVRRHVQEERLRRAERDAALEVAAALAFTRSVPLTMEGIEREYRRAVRRRLRRR